MRLCALVVVAVVALAGGTAAAQVEPPPPVAVGDLRRTLERIEREAAAVVLHPDSSLGRAMAIGRWAADVTDAVREGDFELRGEAALLQLAGEGLAAAARRNDGTDVRAWALVVRDRARSLAYRLTGAP